VAGKIVYRVYVLADGAEVGADEIEVVDLTEFASVDLRPQEQDARVKHENVPDHQSGALEVAISMSSFASSTVRVSGFSHSTCLPARSARRARS
jgi:hypothetical protein